MRLGIWNALRSGKGADHRKSNREPWTVNRNSLNILVWGIALLCHAAAKSFGALVVCRIFLAVCESSIMPAFMIVTGMFYTREEQTLRVGYWCA